jgi:hypothetical protein
VTNAQGHPIGGLYGTALATMGMLATCGYILAMRTFGPITDNADGIIEMSGAAEEVRQKTDRMDAVGNTMKALTKGYAIGSAALAAFLLFSAYMDELSALIGQLFVVVNLAKVHVFIGGLMGAMLVFLFSALALRAVGHTASYVIHAVRRQFHEHPGIMRGELKPDDARRVDIVTAGALKEMVPSWTAGGWDAHRRGAGPPGRGGSGAVAGSDNYRHSAGHSNEQCRRRVGQCEKIHRKQRLWQQGLRHPQSRRCGGYRRGSLQRYRRSIPARPDQAPQHHYLGHGPLFI